MPCFHKNVSPSAEQSGKYSLGKDGCLKSQTLPKLVNFAVAKCLFLVSSTLFATHFALLVDQRQTLFKAALVEACSCHRKDLRMR